MPRVSSWLIAAAAMACGTFLWRLDEISDALTVGWMRDLIEICEFLIFVPGLGIAGFATSETMRRRSERLRDERALHQRERLQLLGLVTANVAHEIRNPLHSIRLILDEMHAGRDLGADHGRLLHHLLRIDRTVAMAYRITDPGGPADLPEAIRAIVREEEEARGHPLPIDLDLPSGAPPVMGGGALAVIIANLLRNALAAAEPSAGRVRVTVVGSAAALHLTIRNPGHLPAGLDPSRPRSVESAGLGLGLFICQQLAGVIGAALALAQHADGVHTTVSLPLAGRAAP